MMAVLSKSEEGQKNHAVAIEILQKASQRIHWTKTDVTPSQSVIFQRLINCTSPLMYFLLLYEKQTINDLIESVNSTFDRHETIPAKHFAAALCLINDTYKVLVSVSIILILSAYKLLGATVQPFNCSMGQFIIPNWITKVKVSSQVMSELKLLQSQLNKINSQHIMSI